MTLLNKIKYRIKTSHALLRALRAVVVERYTFLKESATFLLQRLTKKTKNMINSPRLVVDSMHRKMKGEAVNSYVIIMM